MMLFFLFSVLIRLHNHSTNFKYVSQCYWLCWFWFCEESILKDFWVGKPISPNLFVLCQRFATLFSNKGILISFFWRTHQYTFYCNQVRYLVVYFPASAATYFLKDSTICGIYNKGDFLLFDPFQEKLINIQIMNFKKEPLFNKALLKFII